MLKEDLVLVAQQKAIEYSRDVRRQRKLNKVKKAVTGIVVAAFFVVGLGIVGKNDLESQGVFAKESETETYTSNGTIKFKDLIQTEEGYLWKADANYPKGTEVYVLFDNNGTEDPLDDVVLDVVRK